MCLNGKALNTALCLGQKCDECTHITTMTDSKQMFYNTGKVEKNLTQGVCGISLHILFLSDTDLMMRSDANIFFYNFCSY